MDREFELALVERVRAGETAAFDAVHAAFNARLYGFLARLARSRDIAEDLLEETWLRFVTHAGQLHADTRLGPWLFTVARNIVIDEWRTRRAQSEFPLAEVPEPREPDDDRTDQLLLSWVVAEALTKLSREHQSVLLECYYRGRSVGEAARVLGVPEGTVKSRTHYALRALRLALEELGVGS